VIPIAARRLSTLLEVKSPPQLYSTLSLGILILAPLAQCIRVWPLPVQCIGVLAFIQTLVDGASIFIRSGLRYGCELFTIMIFDGK
jgi:hypothetical protein